MTPVEETLEDVLVGVSIVDGRVEVSAGGRAEVSLHVPEPESLSKSGMCLSLRIVGDGYDATIDIDGDDVHTLGSVIDDVRDDLEGAPSENVDLDGATCPRCGEPIGSATVAGPSDATLSPCGHVVPVDVLAHHADEE